MSGSNSSRRGRGRGAWLACAALLAASWSAGAALAQTVPSDPFTPIPTTATDGGVVQTGCSTCGGGGGGLLEGGCGCGAGGNCVPGRDMSMCSGWCPDTCVGRFLNGVYQCICCPDPCYEPKWLPVADSAFFVDAARPITQMKLTYDHGFGLRTPDRAEYIMARDHTDPKQLGPGGPCAPANNPGKGMNCIANRVDYDSLNVYMEGATARVGVFVSVPYESLDFTTAPISPTACCHVSGFGDMTVGTKTLILDCELLQLSTEFKTFIPTGNFTKSLGTAHVSLEPSLLLNLRLTPDCYIQAQASYWIPIGGDALYDANIFHQHCSLNCVLWCPCPGLQLVGTAELNNWWILGGAYTSTDFLAPDPNNGGKLSPVAISSSGADILSAGPGLRLFICEKIDIGVGSAIHLSGDRWTDELVRTEFRWRF